MTSIFELVVERIPSKPDPKLTAALGLILVLVLVLPFVSRKIEENLEPFFLVMGLTGVAINWAYGVFDSRILKILGETAVTTPVILSGKPIGITEVVFIAGLLFLYYHKPIYRAIFSLVDRLGLPLFAFVISFLLGSIASIISVIVTAVILAEIVAGLPLEREAKIKFSVYSAFSVGLGAALTPIGEPLSTIAVSKLGVGFTYLIDLLGKEVFLGIFLASLANALAMRRYAESVKGKIRGLEVEYPETLRGITVRTIRVYIFVAALELLGGSLTPITVWYFSKMGPHILYWLNTISAVVDNATLTAAEIYKGLTILQQKSALISLLISGGMLIPGNIPNIVMAGRLKINMREWARLGVPFGILMLLLFYALLFVFHF
jgi:predicted cation transporter